MVLVPGISANIRYVVLSPIDPAWEKTQTPSLSCASALIMGIQRPWSGKFRMALNLEA